MKIHQLTKSKGLVDKAKRRGRGNSSGKGNYSGKGHKGQKARSGFSMKPFFEGGQTSIVQRIPKAKGFKRHYKLVASYEVINLSRLESDMRITSGIEITKTLLKDLGYIKSESLLVKILGDGELTKKLTFTGIEKFSKSAETKISEPGKKSEKGFKIYKKIEKAPKRVQKKATKTTTFEKKEPIVKKVETKLEKAPVQKTPVQKTLVVQKKPTVTKKAEAKVEKKPIQKPKTTEKKATIKKK